jgi:hypothetical protein
MRTTTRSKEGYRAVLYDTPDMDLELKYLYDTYDEAQRDAVELTHIMSAPNIPPAVRERSLPIRVVFVRVTTILEVEG